MSVLDTSAPHPALPPAPVVLEGRWCRLEPLMPTHANHLFVACCDGRQEDRHRYLFEEPPRNPAAMEDWISATREQTHAFYFAVIDQANNRCGGRQAFLRMRPEHGSIELGSILWGEGIAGTRIATEAFYLTARHVFEELVYRRFEWKCNNLNHASKRAAIRFGFSYEGLFRQDMIIKGKNRDTAWFSMLDSEWRDLKPLFEDWLDPENFEGRGIARTKLASRRSEVPE